MAHLKNTDRDYQGISNEDIHTLIQKTIKGKLQDLFKQSTPLIQLEFLFISNLVNYISNGHLLKNTITMLKDFGFLKDYEAVINLKELEDKGLSTDEHNKLIAFITSSLLEYELLTKYDDSIHKPPFLYEFTDNKTIKFNCNDWNQSLKNSFKEKLGDMVINTPFNQQEDILKTIIYELIKLNSRSEDTPYKSDIGYFYDLTNFVKTFPSNVENLRENKFYDAILDDVGFQIFEKWMENSDEEDPLYKISFIIQQLKKEGKTRNTTFRFVLGWLHKHNYIDDKVKTDFLVNGSFLSPSKVFTKTRLRIYNSILNN